MCFNCISYLSDFLRTIFISRFLSSASNEIRFCEEELSSSLEGSGALTNTAVQLTPADHIPGTIVSLFLFSAVLMVTEIGIAPF